MPRITGSTLTNQGTTNNTTLDNVGIILHLQPRIGKDGLVTMAIDAEKSDVGPVDEGIPISINTTGEVIRSPKYNTSVAQTAIHMVDRLIELALERHRDKQQLRTSM